MGAYSRTYLGNSHCLYVHLLKTSFFLLPDVFQTKVQITPKMTAKFNTKIDSRKKPPISLNMVGSLAPLSKVGIGMLVLKCRPYLAQKNGFKKMEFLFVDRKCREICDWLPASFLYAR